MNDRIVSFECEGDLLHGILHHDPASKVRRGVLVVVGGPQYRVGSHRQFVLLARHLAANGIPVMRFDYRGMGDSEGALNDFQQVNADIRAALDCFFAQQDLGIEEVVLWGLCDAASAGCFYAYRDPRVTGLVLLNPWVRTDTGEAKAVLKHYYLQRLTEREFWQKVASFQFDWRKSVKDLAIALRKVLRTGPNSVPAGDDSPFPGDAPIPERMLFGLQRFAGPVLLILSGRDLTAREFEDTLKHSPEWRAWAEQASLRRHDLADADHTFSRKLWRDQVADWTLGWLRSW